MTDIVEKLRAPLGVMQCGERDMPDGSSQRFWIVALEAAVEIERLRAALSTARADALEEAARCADNYRHPNMALYQPGKGIAAAIRALANPSDSPSGA